MVTQRTSLVEGVFTLPLLSHISPVLSNRLVLFPCVYTLALEGLTGSTAVPQSSQRRLYFDIFDDEISKQLEYLQVLVYGDSLGGLLEFLVGIAAVVDCGGCLVAFGAHNNPRQRNSAQIHCSTMIGQNSMALCKTQGVSIKLVSKQRSKIQATFWS